MSGPLQPTFLAATGHSYAHPPPHVFPVDPNAVPDLTHFPVDTQPDPTSSSGFGGRDRDGQKDGATPQGSRGSPGVAATSQLLSAYCGNATLPAPHDDPMTLAAAAASATPEKLTKSGGKGVATVLFPGGSMRKGGSSPTKAASPDRTRRASAAGEAVHGAWDAANVNAPSGDAAGSVPVEIAALLAGQPSFAVPGSAVGHQVSGTQLPSLATAAAAGKSSPHTGPADAPVAVLDCLQQVTPPMPLPGRSHATPPAATAAPAAKHLHGLPVFGSGLCQSVAPGLRANAAVQALHGTLEAQGLSLPPDVAAISKEQTHNVGRRQSTAANVTSTLPPIQGAGARTAAAGGDGMAASVSFRGVPHSPGAASPAAGATPSIVTPRTGAASAARPGTPSTTTMAPAQYQQQLAMAEAQHATDTITHSLCPSVAEAMMPPTLQMLQKRNFSIAAFQSSFASTGEASTTPEMSWRAGRTAATPESEDRKRRVRLPDSAGEDNGTDGNDGSDAYDKDDFGEHADEGESEGEDDASAARPNSASRLETGEKKPQKKRHSPSFQSDAFPSFASKGAGGQRSSFSAQCLADRVAAASSVPNVRGCATKRCDPHELLTILKLWRVSIQSHNPDPADDDAREGDRSENRRDSTADDDDEASKGPPTPAAALASGTSIPALYEQVAETLDELIIQWEGLSSEEPIFCHQTPPLSQSLNHPVQRGRSASVSGAATPQAGRAQGRQSLVSLTGGSFRGGGMSLRGAGGSFRGGSPGATLRSGASASFTEKPSSPPHPHGVGAASTSHPNRNISNFSAPAVIVDALCVAVSFTTKAAALPIMTHAAQRLPSKYHQQAYVQQEMKHINAVAKNLRAVIDALMVLTNASLRYNAHCSSATTGAAGDDSDSSSDAETPETRGGGVTPRQDEGALPSVPSVVITPTAKGSRRVLDDNAVTPDADAKRAAGASPAMTPGRVVPSYAQAKGANPRRRESSAAAMLAAATAATAKHDPFPLATAEQAAWDALEAAAKCRAYSAWALVDIAFVAWRRDAPGSAQLLSAIYGTCTSLKPPQVVRALMSGAVPAKTRSIIITHMAGPRSDDSVAIPSALHRLASAADGSVDVDAETEVEAGAETGAVPGIVCDEEGGSAEKSDEGSGNGSDDGRAATGRPHSARLASVTQRPIVTKDASDVKKAEAALAIPPANFDYALDGFKVQLATGHRDSEPFHETDVVSVGKHRVDDSNDGGERSGIARSLAKAARPASGLKLRPGTGPHAVDLFDHELRREKYPELHDESALESLVDMAPVPRGPRLSELVSAQREKQQVRQQQRHEERETGIDARKKSVDATALEAQRDARVEERRKERQERQDALEAEMAAMRTEREARYAAVTARIEAQREENRRNASPPKKPYVVKRHPEYRTPPPEPATPRADKSSKEAGADAAGGDGEGPKRKGRKASKTRRPSSGASVKSGRKGSASRKPSKDTTKESATTARSAAPAPVGTDSVGNVIQPAETRPRPESAKSASKSSEVAAVVQESTEEKIPEKGSGSPAQNTSRPVSAAAKATPSQASARSAAARSATPRSETPSASKDGSAAMTSAAPVMNNDAAADEGSAKAEAPADATTSDNGAGTAGDDTAVKSPSDEPTVDYEESFTLEESKNGAAPLAAPSGDRTEPETQAEKAGPTDATKQDASDSPRREPTPTKEGASSSSDDDEFELDDPATDAPPKKGPADSEQPSKESVEVKDTVKKTDPEDSVKDDIKDDVKDDASHETRSEGKPPSDHGEAKYDEDDKDEETYGESFDQSASPSRGPSKNASPTKAETIDANPPKESSDAADESAKSDPNDKQTSDVKGGDSSSEKGDQKDEKEAATINDAGANKTDDAKVDSDAADEDYDESFEPSRNPSKNASPTKSEVVDAPPAEAASPVSREEVDETARNESESADNDAKKDQEQPDESNSLDVSPVRADSARKDAAATDTKADEKKQEDELEAAKDKQEKDKEEDDDGDEYDDDEFDPSRNPSRNPSKNASPTKAETAQETPFDDGPAEPNKDSGDDDKDESEAKQTDETKDEKKDEEPKNDSESDGTHREWVRQKSIVDTVARVEESALLEASAMYEKSFDFTSGDDRADDNESPKKKESHDADDESQKASGKSVDPPKAPTAVVGSTESPSSSDSFELASSKPGAASATAASDEKKSAPAVQSTPAPPAATATATGSMAAGNDKDDDSSSSVGSSSVSATSSDSDTEEVAGARPMCAPLHIPPHPWRVAVAASDKDVRGVALAFVQPSLGHLNLACANRILLGADENSCKARAAAVKALGVAEPLLQEMSSAPSSTSGVAGAPAKSPKKKKEKSEDEDGSDDYSDDDDAEADKAKADGNTQPSLVDCLVRSGGFFSLMDAEQRAAAETAAHDSPQPEHFISPTSTLPHDGPTPHDVTISAAAILPAAVVNGAAPGRCGAIVTPSVVLLGRQYEQLEVQRRLILQERDGRIMNERGTRSRSVLIDLSSAGVDGDLVASTSPTPADAAAVAPPGAEGSAAVAAPGSPTQLPPPHLPPPPPGSAAEFTFGRSADATLPQSTNAAARGAASSKGTKKSSDGGGVPAVVHPNQRSPFFSPATHSDGQIAGAVVALLRSGTLPVRTALLSASGVPLAALLSSDAVVAARGFRRLVYLSAQEGISRPPPIPKVAFDDSRRASVAAAGASEPRVGSARRRTWGGSVSGAMMASLMSAGPPPAATVAAALLAAPCPAILFEIASASAAAVGGDGAARKFVTGVAAICADAGLTDSVRLAWRAFAPVVASFGVAAPSHLLVPRNAAMFAQKEHHDPTTADHPAGVAETRSPDHKSAVDDDAPPPVPRISTGLPKDRARGDDDDEDRSDVDGFASPSEECGTTQRPSTAQQNAESTRDIGEETAAPSQAVPPEQPGDETNESPASGTAVTDGSLSFGFNMQAPSGDNSAGPVNASGGEQADRTKAILTLSATALQDATDVTSPPSAKSPISPSRLAPSSAVPQRRRRAAPPAVARAADDSSGLSEHFPLLAALPLAERLKLSCYLLEGLEKFVLLTVSVTTLRLLAINDGTITTSVDKAAVADMVPTLPTGPADPFWNSGPSQEKKKGDAEPLPSAKDLVTPRPMTGFMACEWAWARLLQPLHKLVGPTMDERMAATFLAAHYERQHTSWQEFVRTEDERYVALRKSIRTRLDKIQAIQATAVSPHATPAQAPADLEKNSAHDGKGSQVMTSRSHGSGSEADKVDTGRSQKSAKNGSFGDRLAVAASPFTAASGASSRRNSGRYGHVQSSLTSRRKSQASVSGALLAALSQPSAVPISSLLQLAFFSTLSATADACPPSVTAPRTGLPDGSSFAFVPSAIQAAAATVASICPAAPSMLPVDPKSPTRSDGGGLTSAGSMTVSPARGHKYRSPGRGARTPHTTGAPQQQGKAGDGPGSPVTGAGGTGAWRSGPGMQPERPAPVSPLARLVENTHGVPPMPEQMPRIPKAKLKELEAGRDDEPPTPVPGHRKSQAPPAEFSHVKSRLFDYEKKDDDDEEEEPQVSVARLRSPEDETIVDARWRRGDL